MIRSHVPRGYLWTCTSEFQQTPEYRNIQFEDNVRPGVAILSPGTDLLSSPSHRAAKRRRVETLANRFLDGQQLSIGAARPGLQDISRCVCRHHPSIASGQTAWAEAILPTHGRRLSDRLEDGWDLLRGHVAQLRSTIAGAVPSGSSLGHDRVEIHAEASCTSRVPLAKVHLAREPSEDAFKKAADLRSRVLQKTAAEYLPQESQPPPSAPFSATGTVTESSPVTSEESIESAGPIPTAAWTSSKWIRSGAFELRHKRVDEDCSRDELGASSGNAPMPPRPTRHFGSNLSTAIDSTPAILTAVPYGTSESVYAGIGQARDVDDRLPVDISHAIDTGSGLTNDHATKDQSPCGTSHDPEPQCDSQDQLLEKQGIYAKPRKSWASVNDDRSTARTGGDNQLVADGEDVRGACDGVPSVLRSSTSESAQHSGKRSKTKKAKVSRTAQQQQKPPKTAPPRTGSRSFGHEQQDLPVDQQRRMGTFRIKCAVSMGQNASPFVFRKRVSTSDGEDLDPEISAKQSPPEQQLSTDGNSSAGILTIASLGQNSISKDSADNATSVQVDQAESDGLLLDTPLTNKHLNNFLPKRGSLEHRSLSVKKAIREEMLLCGAEISRLASDAPSSQLTSGSLARERDPFEGNPSENEAPQCGDGGTTEESQWPGTQALLADAQKDLVASLDHSGVFTGVSLETTLRPSSEGGEHIKPRRPLKTLSQGPLPTTPALINKWSGWSTTKKSKGHEGKRESLGLSPSMGKGLTSSEMYTTDGSSGRHEVGLANLTRQSASVPAKGGGSSGFAFSSYQAAQDPNASMTKVKKMVVPDLDSQELDQTVQELMHDVLNTQAERV